MDAGYAVIMTAEVFVVGVGNRALGGTKGDSFAPVVYSQSWYLTYTSSIL